MPKYALFDSSAPAPARVTGWLDTDQHTYAQMPASDDLLLLTAAQWTGRMANPSGWAVSGGALVAYTPPPPPPPTLAQQAASMLAAGIAIVSTATPALNGTYPCDTATNNSDGNILAALNAGLTLPNNVVVRLDTAGNAHAFAAADFKNLCQAKLTFQQTLQTIIGNNAGTLPTQPVTIA